MSGQRLVRSDSEKVIAGVCGGIAMYLQIDPLLVRIAFLLLIPASGLGPLLYLILMVIMPRESDLQTAPRAYVQENLASMGQTFSESIDKMSQSEKRPVVGGAILILLGVFFLFSNFGWFDAGIFWSLLLVAVGLFILLRRSE